MNLLRDRVSWEFAVLGWALLLPALLVAWRTLRRPFFPSALAEHGWYAGIAAVSLAWLLQIKVDDGPAFGMLGAGLFCLVFGSARGLLGLVLAVVVHTALTGGSFANVGINGVLIAAVPAFITDRCRRLIALRLPSNPFVFMIGNGMFTTLAATVATGTCLLLAAGAAGGEHWRSVAQCAGPMLLLAWSEAIVSGMLFSALVVFAPEAVLTYRPEAFLPDPRSGSG